MSLISNLNKKSRAVFSRFIKLEQYVCAVLLIIMTLITFVQVVLRFIIRRPYSGAEEITLMILVWFGYLCMSVDVFTDTHAALFMVYDKLSGMTKKVFYLFRHALLTWFFIMLIKYGMMLTKLNIRKTQAATGISAGWLYAPLVVGGVIMLVFSLSNLLNTILKPASEFKKAGGEK